MMRKKNKKFFLKDVFKDIRQQLLFRQSKSRNDSSVSFRLPFAIIQKEGIKRSSAYRAQAFSSDLQIRSDLQARVL